MARNKKQGRLHLRLDEQLVADLHDYAKRHGTSVNAVASMLFEQLLEREKETKYEAEQV